jgi:hypothetical protein
MKIAYGVSLTNSKRKTEDPQDIVNFRVFINDTRYYDHNGQYSRQLHLARPMTEACAKALAEKLKHAAQEVNMIELLTDDDQYLPENLAELNPVYESLEITALKDSIEYSLKSGMSPSEILRICESEVLGAARLRAVIQECRAKRIKGEDILATVNHAVKEGEKA